MKLSLKLMIAVTLCALDLSVGWAQRQYPGSPGLPEDVVWMREIYRTLDLTKDTNGALYYPVEPQGNKMNLFRYRVPFAGAKRKFRLMNISWMVRSAFRKMLR